MLEIVNGPRSGEYNRACVMLPVIFTVMLSPVWVLVNMFLVSVQLLTVRTPWSVLFLPRDHEQGPLKLNAAV